MLYENIKEAVFLSRLNRFVACIEIDGRTELCHVKNTGRCRELLLEGAPVYVQEKNVAGRKTKYDLVSVFKGEKLVNVDSSAPNKVFYEWLVKSGYFGFDSHIESEKTYGNSRLDFYIEKGAAKIFIEVKGVTLEEDGVALFPDAPTIRGIKHIKELIRCKEEGFEAYGVFIIQMEGVDYFTPNDKTHRAFGETLKIAADKGVKLIALCCNVGKSVIEIKEFVRIKL
jgi:sugar fermentation stimulation protein A